MLLHVIINGVKNMSYPIIAVYPPKATEHPHIAKYICDIHINPLAAAESQFMHALTDYTNGGFRWWYNVDGDAAPAEVVSIINNHSHPQYCHFNRVYRRDEYRAENKPSFIDYAVYLYDHCILTNGRVPANQLPADKTGYILLNADSTDVEDIVVYRLNEDTAFITLSTACRINEFVDPHGQAFTEGRIGNISFDQLDRQIIESSQAWFMQAAGKRNKPRIGLRPRSYMVRIIEDFDSSESPDNESVSPAMVIQKAAEDALYSEYSKFQVVKPDGQLLSVEGFGKNAYVGGKYIHDYLASLPTDTYIKLYW